MAPDFTAAAASLAEKELEKLLKEEFEQKRPALSGWLLFLLEDYRCFPTILSERNYYGKKFRLDLVIDGGRGIEKKVEMNRCSRSWYHVTPLKGCCAPSFTQVSVEAETLHG